MLTAKRILVAQTAFLGDLVLTLPLVHELHRLLPGTSIDLLVRAPFADLVRAQPGVHAVIGFDKRGHDAGIAGLRSVAAGLRATQYDVALAGQSSFRTGLLLRLAGIKRRIGFAATAGTLWYTHRVALDKSRHFTDRMLSLLAAIGASVPQDLHPMLAVNSTALAAVSTRLRAEGLGDDDRFVVIAPGSVWPTKQWEAAGFAAVAAELARDGYRVILTGGNADRAAIQAVATQFEAALDWSGATTLPELAALLSRAALFVGNDSGPMHVAGAVGTPVVSVFGPTTPELGFAPRAARARALGIALPCRPCHIHGPVQCPEGHHRCMKDMSSDTVVSAAREVIASE